MQPNVVDLRYFKLWILVNQIIWVWNIIVLHYPVAEILGLENLSLWQKLNFFIFINESSILNSNCIPFEIVFDLRLKNLSLCNKFWFSNPYIFTIWYFKLILFDLPEFIILAKVYEIGWQRVCCNDSISLFFLILPSLTFEHLPLQLNPFFICRFFKFPIDIFTLTPF